MGSPIPSRILSCMDLALERVRNHPQSYFHLARVRGLVRARMLGESLP